MNIFSLTLEFKGSVKEGVQVPFRPHTLHGLGMTLQSAIEGAVAVMEKKYPGTDSWNWKVTKAEEIAVVSFNRSGVPL